MEWLSKILEGLPNAQELEEKIKNEIPKGFVPKDRYNEMAQRKRLLETKQIETENERLLDIAVSSAIKAAAAQHKFKDAEVVRLLLDKNLMKVSEVGTLTGFDEQISSLKKNRPYLFGEEPLAGRTPYAGVETPPITREQFSKMGYRERNQLFEHSPEVYKSLAEN